MNPAWIVAILASIGLIFTLAAGYAGLKSDIRALEVKVESLDRVVAQSVAAQIRMENLVLGMLGRGPNKLEE